MVLMANSGPFQFLVIVGDRIAQIVFPKKENIVFKKVDKLSCTARGGGGFGSTIKKIKKDSCICQFQVRFNLILLNQVKFDLKTLVCLYNEIINCLS